MKTILAAAFALLPSILLASESSLAFPQAQITGAPHSLEESAQVGVPSLVRDWSPIPQPIVISRMPIVDPSSNCDLKMVFKPDESRDYKLTVITPSVESGR